jgi:hypothetical protein
MPMNRVVTVACHLGLACGLVFVRPCAASAAAAAAPQQVTLGGIIHPATDDTLSFTPDGNTVFFDRSEGKRKTIMVSRKVDGRWSQPQVAAFSGRWYDQDPALAPDGSYIVFSSDRPVTPGGKRLVRDVDGKAYHGGNLWKVQREGTRWSAPTWLGAVANQSSFLVSPSVAADGTLYFIQQDHRDHAMHIFSSHRRDGRYLAPVRVALGDPATTTHDPAIAPDQSFIVFGYGRTAVGLGRLCIAFREGDHWSKPVDLGDAVTSVGPWGSHVLPDGRTVTFTGGAALYRLSLEPWLSQRGGHS